MKYPTGFEKKVRECFPDSKMVIDALESGNAFLGRILDDSSQGGIQPREIIEAFEMSKTDELLQRALRLKKLEDLYKEWIDLYREQFPPR